MNSQIADVFEHLKYLVREPLDFVSEGGGDVVEAFVEIAGGGLDVFMQV
jgi:hypothetical protein